MVCRSLFFLLCCLSFIDLRLLSTTLVSQTFGHYSFYPIVVLNLLGCHEQINQWKKHLKNQKQTNKHVLKSCVTWDNGRVLLMIASPLRSYTSQGKLLSINKYKNSLLSSALIWCLTKCQSKCLLYWLIGVKDELLQYFSYIVALNNKRSSKY